MSFRFFARPGQPQIAMRRARAGDVLLGASWSISWAIMVCALGRGVFGFLAYGVWVRLQFPVIDNWCRDACLHCGFPGVLVRLVCWCHHVCQHFPDVVTNDPRDGVPSFLRVFIVSRV